MYDAVVLGAGVIGLSTARELHDRGLKVAVVARDLPHDSHSVGFASPWAGCNWHSFETDPSTPNAQWDAITFRKLAKLAAEHPQLCERIPFETVWENDDAPGNDIWFKDLVGDYKRSKPAPGKPLAGNLPFGHTFTSYVLHAPAYIDHLGAELRARRVPLYRRRLSALDEAYDLPGIGKVALVVNATALGSKSLIGVEDDRMYPARGQTVLVHAPGVKKCYMHVEGFMPGPLQPGQSETPSPPAYIIPRPGPEGHVVLGGTYLKNNYSSLPDLAEAQRILQDCYALEPRLAGPHGKSWRDIQVISHNVGLRPAREGGARLELEYREVGGGGAGAGAGLAPIGGRSGPRRSVAVVHAYGSGSAGFQGSLGIAEKAADLAQGYLAKHSASAKL